MSAHCYILYSKTKNKFYTGATQDSLEDRINKHNNHTYGNHRYTAMANDWELFIKIEVDDFAYAIRIEKYIKSMKSSQYIRNLKKYPELINKIKRKTSS